MSANVQNFELLTCKGRFPALTISDDLLLSGNLLVATWSVRLCWSTHPKSIRHRQGMDLPYFYGGFAITFRYMSELSLISLLPDKAGNACRIVMYHVTIIYQGKTLNQHKRDLVFHYVSILCTFSLSSSFKALLINRRYVPRHS